MSWILGFFLLLTIIGAAVLGWFFHAYQEDADLSDPREAGRVSVDNG